MRKRMTPAAYVIFFLLIIGILYTFYQSPSTLLIPVIVFGVIYLLYKYPILKWLTGSNRTQSERSRYKSALKKQKMHTSRRASFTVIKGSKADDRDDGDDDDRPLYH